MDLDQEEVPHKKRMQVLPTATETLGPMLLKLAADLDSSSATVDYQRGIL